MVYGFLSRLLRRRASPPTDTPRSGSQETSQTQTPTETSTCQALFKQDVPQADKTSYSIRIAAYDTPSSIPRVIEVSNSDITALIAEASDIAYSLSHEKGGRIPYVVIKEIVENLIHADFTDAVITISSTGDTIRVSDHGPGIADKTRCFLPGFTTANARLRKYIKGVGSGLAIASESMALMGGQVIVEDNLSGGSVVTLELGRRPASPPPVKTHPSAEVEDAHASSSLQEKPQNSLESTKMKYSDSIPPQSPRHTSQAVALENQKPPPDAGVLGTGSLRTDEQRLAAEKSPGIPAPQGQARDPDHQARIARLKEIDDSLSSRQKKVFMLIAEVGDLGPSTVTKELDISLSTAYRDLVVLEEHGLVQATDGGKRKLTDLGIEYLSYLFR